MAANMTTLADILRYQYGPGVANDIPYYSLFMNLANDNRAEGLPRISTKTIDTGGTGFKKPVRYAGNSSFSIVADRGAFPPAGNQAFKEGNISVKTAAASVEISGWVDDASRSSKFAAVDVVEDELKSLPRDFAEELDRILLGWGYGILGQLNGDPGTGTTLTMNNALVTKNETVNGTKYLKE